MNANLKALQPAERLKFLQRGGVLGEAAPAVTSCKAAAGSLQLSGNTHCPSSRGTAKTLSHICHLPHPSGAGEEHKVAISHTGTNSKFITHVSALC